MKGTDIAYPIKHHGSKNFNILQYFIGFKTAINVTDVTTMLHL